VGPANPVQAMLKFEPEESSRVRMYAEWLQLSPLWQEWDAVGVKRYADCG
jgi:hypothetical protein